MPRARGISERFRSLWRPATPRDAPTRATPHHQKSPAARPSLALGL
jgi:hypothetical protein